MNIIPTHVVEEEADENAVHIQQTRSGGLIVTGRHSGVLFADITFHGPVSFGGPAPAGWMQISEGSICWAPEAELSLYSVDGYSHLWGRVHVGDPPLSQDQIGHTNTRADEQAARYAEWDSALRDVEQARQDMAQAMQDAQAIQEQAVHDREQARADPES